MNRGRFAVVSCIYASYLISFFMSLAYIISFLFKLNLRIKSLKNQLDISESELDLAQTEKRKIQEENLDKDKEIQVPCVPCVIIDHVLSA